MPEAARWTKCTAWVGERTKHHDGASRPSSAHELCSRYTFTAAGSELMAERIRIAARAAGGVPVLDANSITRTGGGCNATEDVEAAAAVTNNNQPLHVGSYMLDEVDCMPGGALPPDHARLRLGRRAPALARDPAREA